MYACLLLAIFSIQGTYAQSCISVSPPVHPQEELSVPEAFRKFGIVDDYLPEPPNDLLVGGHVNHEVKLGSILSPLATLNPIQLSYPQGKEGEKYVVLFLGLDVPSRENSVDRAYIHGMIVNSPAHDVRRGDVAVPVSPGVPFPDGEMRRYLALLYKQNGTMDPESVDLMRLAQKRKGFKVTDFAEKHGLGKPLAGNFFLSSLSPCGST